jgi:hypothetical protein
MNEEKMPDEIAGTIKAITPEEQTKISDLFKLVDSQMIPWKQLWEYQILSECYNFRELKQWNGADMQALALADTPSVPIDRMGRIFDTVNGIRKNTGNKVKVIPRETGDNKLAEVLGEVFSCVEYDGNFEEVYDTAFDDGMLTTGIGIVKFGFDPVAKGGEGEIFAEYIPIEHVGWSKTHSKTLKDVTWCWFHQIMPWEDALPINPQKINELKAIKTTANEEWERIKMNNTQGTFLANDYGVPGAKAEIKYNYPDQVHLWEFWKLKRIPIKKVARFNPQVDQIGQPVLDVMQRPVINPVPEVRAEDINYGVVDNEIEIGTTVQEEWWQTIIATDGSKSNGVLLKEEKAKYSFAPILAMCADMKKSGAPFGLAEKLIPHQKRINIAWAQKIAYNNKSIKAPLVVRGVTDLDSKLQTSRIGTVLNLGQNEEILNYNVQSAPFTQSIEEGNVARADMDFIAAASEPVMTGNAGATTSGLQLSMQQSAAITPLNKWVDAERKFLKEFGRRVLEIIVTEYSPQKIIRIIGQDKFAKYFIPQPDPLTGRMTQPLQFPFEVDSISYDVEIQEQAISDLNKQQSFNAAMALGGREMFTDDYLIMNAPIKNTDDALVSADKKRQDIMIQMAQQIQMLTQELQQTQKLIPKENKPINQHKNAQTGRNQPQAGQQSMLGGTGTNNPIGMGV